MKKPLLTQTLKKVIVQDGSGRPILINCLEDSGRQVTLITNRLVDSLGIAKCKGQLILSGVGSQRIKLHDEVLVHVRPECSEMSFPVRAHAIPKISNHLPAFDVDEVKKRYPDLRDVEVKLDKESIDLLVGQDRPVLLRQVEARYGNPDEPNAVRTVYGWSICGPIDWSEDDERSTHFISCMWHFSGQDSDFNLRSFWVFCKFPNMFSLYSPVKSNRSSNKQSGQPVKVNNRYQVKLPWKKDNDQIPESYDMALRRLDSTEQRLKKSQLL